MVSCHFTTGSSASSGIRLLGAYSDWPEDEDHDGKYDQLIIDVAIESALNDANTTWCDLNAQLLDGQGGEVDGDQQWPDRYCRALPGPQRGRT